MRRNLANIASLAAIVAVSTLLGALVSWRTPGIDQYTRDWMFQERGPLPAPDDIAIVAIDEPSIARYGRFPWPRALAARAIDVIAEAEPKAIALDVLYADPTTDADDDALARSIQRAGNVVVAAQLVAPPAPGGPASWLLPLPAIERAAAAVGHVNVSTESDDVARQLLVREADDLGHAIRAMAVEAIRVGEGIAEPSVTETSRRLLLGPRIIPLESSPPSAVIGSVEGLTQTLLAGRMAIDFIGPAGSFRTCSFADVIDGRIPVSQLRGKYVLLGATAASLGDRLASPFVHQVDVRADQHGSLMPGVEVLANAVNTILRSRFYSETPDWLTFLFGAGVAALTLFGLAIGQGPYETLKQIGVLAAVISVVLWASYSVFTRLLVFPPLTLSVISFGSAGVLGLLRRSFITSSHVDRSIEEIQRAGEFPAVMSLNSAAESIARLTDAEGVAIYSSREGGRIRLVAAHGIAIARSGFSGSAPSPHNNLGPELLAIPIDGPDGAAALVVTHGAARIPSTETQSLCAAIAGSAAEIWAEKEGILPWGWRWWPRGLARKARSLRRLNGRILDRVKFVDLALQSVEDALIIAGVDGRITFANRRAASILNSSEGALRGRALLDLLAEVEQTSPEDGRDVLIRLVVDRAKIEREVTIRGARPGYFILRMSAVCSGEDGRGSVQGIVASLSDVTRQHELQQTKNDVMALVSHEMRTPLTAIQGMSELQAQFDLDPGRSREMSIAIHDEAKRLTRMISEYLDITRLESGTTVLRRSAVRIEALVERTLLMLDPLAAARRIRLVRRWSFQASPVLADGDLLSRAIGNLVSNAIKYSAPKTEVVISVREDTKGVSIEVADQGYGIPERSLNRVFEKFYRVPRVEDVDVPGTGLGLALVKEVAELHSGLISVRSSIGAGSVFTLWIPCGEEKP